MVTHPSPLIETAALLRKNQLDLPRYINEICDRIAAAEPSIHALLPESDRRMRLLNAAAEIEKFYPNLADRPPLYGIVLGVKDMIRTDGFSTRCGSRLPPELFAGEEARCVKTLRQAGALVLGKTITSEFACAEPGPTRNPYALTHTPGGSSSGSAAAVAAGFCPLALGTQTSGSTIRPAAYCGIVGFKSSYGRIPSEGLIALAPSADHIGFFTQDVASMAVVASVVCRDWRSQLVHRQSRRKPVLGVPVGPYLQLATTDALNIFEAQVEQLKAAGYIVREVRVLDDIEAIAERHRQMVAYEMAQVHSNWYREYESLYAERTVSFIQMGQRANPREVARTRDGREELRRDLEMLMSEEAVDLWISPAATGPAPEGIRSTGDPIMNVPWTHAGLPVITFPNRHSKEGLPLGIQCETSFMADEALLGWAGDVEEDLRSE